MTSHPAPSTEQTPASAQPSIDRSQSRRSGHAVLFLTTVTTLIASTVVPAVISTVIPIEAAQAQTRSPNSTSTPATRSTAATPRFTCDQSSGEYTVVYNPMSRNGQSYPWAKPASLGGGWSAERRCFEIARRLEEYRPDGLLEMRNSTENGYDIVCVTTESNPSCRIVLTVPPGQNALETRNRVFSNLTIADSGQQTSAVNTYAGGDDGILNQIGEAIGIDLSSVTRNRNRRSSTPATPDAINLRPFLAPSDGGTGEQL